MVKDILSFISQKVLPDQKYFLFYERMHIRHYVIAHNSAHEGTNFGMKNHTAAMKATHRIDQVGKTSNFQACLKAGQIEAEAYKEYIKKKAWTKLPTKNDLISIAEGMLLDIKI